MSYIQTQNIHHSFSELEVLRGVNFSMEKGEIVAIVGKSGAGKTTLLQIIGTLLKPTSGKVIIDGVDVFSLSANALAAFRNHHIGFIFQYHQLLPEFTALENVMMPALIAGEEEKDARARATQLLRSLGLAERLQHKPQQLSGGEQQRVAAARAIMMSPSVILADEPSGSLDSKNKQELHQLLLNLRDNFSQTIIIVTHDKELAAIADRVVEMQDGKIIEKLNNREIKMNDEL